MRLYYVPYLYYTRQTIIAQRFGSTGAVQREWLLLLYRRRFLSRKKHINVFAKKQFKPTLIMMFKRPFCWPSSDHAVDILFLHNSRACKMSVSDTCGAVDLYGMISYYVIVRTGPAIVLWCTIIHWEIPANYIVHIYLQLYDTKTIKTNNILFDEKIIISFEFWPIYVFLISTERLQEL